MKPIIVTEDLWYPGLKVVIRDGSSYLHQGKRTDGKKMKGEILKSADESKWVRVRWENGTENNYQVGFEGMYDLEFYVPESKQETTPTVQELRSGLEEASKYVKVDYETYEMERGYDTYGKSLKPNKNDHRDTRDSTGVYTGNPLYLPSKSFTLQRGERPEGRRLQG